MRHGTMNARTLFARKLVKTIRQVGEIEPSEARTERRASRRDFLQTLALAGTGTLVGCAGFGGGKAPASAPKGTVAIVGAGSAGLTAAYRLQKHGVAVHLYEGSARFGGRMWTRRNFNEDGMFCELGGELVDSNHREIIALAKELGVGVQRLKGERTTAGDYYFTDGKLRTDAELIPAFAPLARRIAKDIDTLYDKKGNFTGRAHLLDRTPLNRYLWETGRATGTAEWLLKTLDVAWVTEFGVETSRQSALNMIDMISPDTREGFEIYGDSDEAFRIRGGSGSLTDALHKAIDGKVEIHSNHRLTRIDDDGREIALTFANGQATQRIGYEKVILALPYPVLRDVRGVDRLALSQPKRDALENLGWGANAKVMLGYQSRFWETLAPANHGGAFSDALFQTWNASNGQKGPRGILTCYIGGAAARRFSHGSAAGYVEKVTDIFPAAKGLYDGHRASMDWTHFAFSKGSFSATGVGQYCDMIPAGATPELGGRLLFAGEHTSEESPGYMNGGVESGERAAAQMLRIARR